MKSIPQGWKYSLLSDFVEKLDAGVSVNAEDVSASNGQVGVLKLSCVSKGIFNPKENKTILPQEVCKARVSPQKHCIIISRSNTQALVGASAYISEDYPTLFLPDTLWQTVYHEGILFSPRWLSYWLQAPSTRRRLGSIAAGTSGSMKKLSKPVLLSIEVLVPTFEEQEKIAEILSTLDSAIYSVEALISAKTKLKRGLMQQLLTGKTRFKEFSETEWKLVHLGDIFRERCETYADVLKKLQKETPEEGAVINISLELLSITAKEGVVRRDSLDKRDTSSEDKSKYLRICPGDIGYNTMRMWQGVSGLSELEGIVSPAYTICTPTEEIDGKFASYLFKYLPVVHLFWRYSQGLVDDTLSLKFPHFAQIKVLIPPINEQRRIAAVFVTFDKEIRFLEKKLNALRRQKRGLMQKLLTGKIRVKTADVGNEELVNS
jgi:type I restriction enzyme S subunit